MGVHRVGGLIVAAEDNAPVLHGGHAQHSGGDMNDRVDVCKVNVQNGVGFGGAVASSYGIHAGQILGGLQEIIGVLHRQSSTPQRDGAVFGTYMGELKLTDGLNPGAVGGGGPTTHDNLLSAAHFLHQAA